MVVPAADPRRANGTALASARNVRREREEDMGARYHRRAVPGAGFEVTGWVPARESPGSGSGFGSRFVPGWFLVLDCGVPQSWTNVCGSGALRSPTTNHRAR